MTGNHGKPLKKGMISRTKIDALLGKATSYKIYYYPEKRRINWPKFWEGVLEKTEGHGN